MLLVVLENNFNHFPLQRWHDRFGVHGFFYLFVLRKVLQLLQGISSWFSSSILSLAVGIIFSIVVCGWKRRIFPTLSVTPGMNGNVALLNRICSSSLDFCRCLQAVFIHHGV